MLRWFGCRQRRQIPEVAGEHQRGGYHRTISNESSDARLCQTQEDSDRSVLNRGDIRDALREIDEDLRLHLDWGNLSRAFYSGSKSLDIPSLWMAHRSWPTSFGTGWNHRDQPIIWWQDLYTPVIVVFLVGLSSNLSPVRSGSNMGHNCLANGAFLGSETIHIKNLVEIAILYHYRKDGHTSHRCHDPNMLRTCVVCWKACWRRTKSGIWVRHDWSIMVHILTIFTIFDQLWRIVVHKLSINCP
jgi:hypothetical protein